MEDAGSFSEFVFAVPRADDVLHAGVECAFCEACTIFSIPAYGMRYDGKEHTDKESQDVELSWSIAS